MVFVMTGPPADNSHRIGAEFLITDLEVALTFLDVAQTSSNPETIRRNREHARPAYDTVLSLLSKVKVDESQRRSIKERLGKLRERLEDAGYRL